MAQHLRAAPIGKRVRTDRIIYTFALAPLADDLPRQAALVIVWHEGGSLVTHFLPDIAIVKANGEVDEE